MLRNGIVNGELQVPESFSYYKSGILSSEHLRSMESEEITDKALEDYGFSWMNLNHSVVITGWGVDKETGAKYWIVRNSYGPKWGNHGNLWVTRGINEFGIESETTGYDVRLCSAGSTTSCELEEPNF